MPFNTNIACLTLLLLPCSLALSAQSENKIIDEVQQWYQIEVFIFSYKNNTPQLTVEASERTGAERWPQQLGLKYPPRVMQLHPPIDNKLSVDSLLKVDAEKEPSSNPIISNGATSQSAIGSPLDQSLQEEQKTNTATLQENRLTTTVSPPEQPFILLAKDQLELASPVQRLTRQNDIKQLFHAAWRQPISTRDKADSILIRGGQQFDNHFELEGYITLGLERYLHINTDLWLSQFVSNDEELENPWPVLPRLPPISNAREINTQSPITSDLLSSEAFASDASVTTTNTFSFDQPLPPVSTIKTDDFISIQQLSSLTFDNPFLNTVNDQYSLKSTVTMRQQRRMRSRELHYIDHPLMGLIIKITPYDMPEPELELNPLLDDQIEPSTEETNGTPLTAQ